MSEDLILSALTIQQRQVLRLMAEAGVTGATEEEVAVYLITRGIDDMMRAGVLKLGNEA